MVRVFDFKKDRERLNLSKEKENWNGRDCVSTVLMVGVWRGDWRRQDHLSFSVSFTVSSLFIASLSLLVSFSMSS